MSSQKKATFIEALDSLLNHGKIVIGKYKVTMRHDTKDAWWTANPILRKGEPAFEQDTVRYKMGDGVTPWRQLEYLDSKLQELVHEIHKG